LVNTDTTSTKRRDFNYKNDVNVTRERKTEKEEKVASKRVKMKPHRKRKKERGKDVCRVKIDKRWRWGGGVRYILGPIYNPLVF
jgi:hypothetical protein